MQNKQKGIKLTDYQRLNWLRLIRSENVGAVTFLNLIARFGSAQKAIEALPELNAKGGARKTIRIASIEDAEKEFEKALQMGIKFVCVGEPEYPELLRAIEFPPPLIALRGNVEIFMKPSVAIVGSRNASASGKKLTFQFAKALGDHGFSIVSGLARGIDSAAHQASLDTGTIAVLAGGVDCVYPPENTTLYRDIIHRGGVIISEMPIGWTPRAVDFPRRNRIIAGLSLGLLIVEAAKRSGSLITARIANEIGRLVFAIPGSPLDPRAEGPNKLIRDGAIFITDPDDLAKTLFPLVPNTSPTQPYLFKNMESLLPPQGFNESDSPDIFNEDVNDKERQKVLSALSVTPIDIETLSFHSGVPLNKLYLLLVELDLAGKLVRHSGGYVSLFVQ
ncbi:DNA-processing protein DprA [Bartonella tamiae]|uniref:DNA protecting protein DprA n=1 Tax=Bartonella tamiae Th239 TaxID=1094558 RepID=J0QZS4_9HYPH|nr:DNA-processing protein DprA [Bartonella tamiae]EJF88754.1 DNA protecting protein DprA [Bartonella tamiae Th239]EJF94996.1 DNA protecting protein DprA [Bartonella tamiae Th307]